MIKQQDGKWCLFSKDGSRNLGCFDTEDEAKKHEALIVNVFKNQESGIDMPDLWLTPQEVGEFCPTCETKLRERFPAIKRINVARLFEQAEGEQDIFDAAKTLHGNEIAKCVSKVDGKPGISDAESLCSFLVAKMHMLRDRNAFGVDHAFDEMIEFENATAMVTASGAWLTEAKKKQKDGSEFQVVVIETGFSTNTHPSNDLPILYTQELLERDDTLEKFEGVSVYAYEFKDKDGNILFEHIPDVVRTKALGGTTLNKVGVIENARFGEFKKDDGTKGFGILGNLKVLNSKMRDFLKNAWDAGLKKVVGLSIDASASMREIVTETGSHVNEVLQFFELPEVTVVDKPGAGGILVKMLASANAGPARTNKIKERAAMFEQFLKILREHAPDLVKDITDDMKPEEREAALAKVIESDEGKAVISKLTLKTESADAGSAEGGQDTGDADGGSNGNGTIASMTENELNAMVAKAVAINLDKHSSSAAAKVSSQENLKEAVAKSGLPQEERDEIISEHIGSVMTEAEINRLIKRRQDKWVALKESGIKVPGQSEEINLTKDQEDKWSDALFGMLTGKPENKVEPFVSIHESYRSITGFYDAPFQMGTRIMQDLSQCLTPKPLTISQKDWRMRLREHRLGIPARLRESNLATSTWAEVFGDSIRRAMIMFYSENQFQDWRKIVSEISSAPDYRTMRRMRIGGLADLSDVSELATYTELSWPADEEETFAVGKKGNLLPLSEEAMVNDDLGALRRVPRFFGHSAARTVYKTVFDILRTNPTMGDGVALFHASHSNLGSTALSDAELRVAIRSMRDQTELSSGEVLANASPKYIVGPNELEPTAWELARASNSQNGARTETIENWFLQFGLVPLPPIGYWTDANDWVLVGDPTLNPTIEVSFLNGRQQPELLVQDQNDVGSVFTADKITFKGRIIFGAKALDHRFMYKETP